MYCFVIVGGIYLVGFFVGFVKIGGWVNCVMEWVVKCGGVFGSVGYNGDVLMVSLI